MALRKIRTIGDPILSRTSYEVKDFNNRLLKIATDMRDTMYVAKGLGLSAVQVGLRMRIAVVDARDEKGMYVFVNPEIINTEGSVGEVEGCLSVPDKQGFVVRPEKIKVRFNDLMGRRGEMELDGMLARILQHEIDHMNGILYTEVMEYEVKDE